MTNGFIKIATIVVTSLLTACATVPQEDPYVLYRELMPHSILVLPPINESVDVNASYSWVTTASMPIAEQGYYVFPVAIIDAFMKENGLPNPEDMHGAPLDKLGEIFGADAVLYVTLTEFGQKFELLSSTTRVNAVAKLVDIRTGQVIWNGRRNYSDNSNGVTSDTGLLGALVSAAITQVGNTVTDRTHDVAKIANYVLFQDSSRGLLKGPLHPDFAAQMVAAQAATEAATEATAVDAAVQ